MIDKIIGDGRVAAPELVSLKGSLFAGCQVFDRKSCRAMKAQSTWART